MGNKSNKKKKKSLSQNKVDDVEGFFLEDWEILNDKSKFEEFAENKSKISFNNEILISQVKSDPYKDYTDIKLLGAGSFATVKLVKNKITGLIRAMKIIKKKKIRALSMCSEESEYSSTSGTCRGTTDIDILNEINVLKQIDHPNVVKIFEVYHSEDAYYLITEYCEGGELFNIISQKKKLTEIQCAYIMYQVLSAIKYCHKMKIMHRDLKPENILIYKHDKEKDFYDVKICDFGTSQVFKKGEWQDQPCGSVYYVAPEVLERKYNSKCDLWSCGVIMFMLLSNKAPFGGKTDRDIINNVKKGIYNKNFLKVSDPTLDLIAKLLQKDYKIRINADEAMKHQFFEQYEIKELLNDIKDTSIINRLINNLNNYKCQSIIQETAMAYLVHNYPDLEEVENACKLFNKIDINGDGKITSGIFFQGISKYMPSSSNLKGEILDVFEKLDRDHNNYIGYEDFIRAAVDKNIFLREDVLKFAFKYFDKNNEGEINYNSISSIFKEHLKSNEVEENLKKIMDEVDKDSDGKIDYQDFCKLMKKIL